jgi:hypothetical protein
MGGIKEEGMPEVYSRQEISSYPCVCLMDAGVIYKPKNHP